MIRSWSRTSPSGKFCVTLTQAFIGYLLDTANNGIAALPPQDLMDLFHNSDSVMAACNVSAEDALGTPGLGYCGPAAKQIIQHHEKTGVYLRPSLTDPNYRATLTGAIASTQHALLTTRRSPEASGDGLSTRNKLRATLGRMARGLTPSKGRKVCGPKALNSCDYMPAEEFLLMTMISHPSTRLMLWIAIPGSAQTVLTPFSNAWAMAADAVDNTHNTISGSCTPAQLISASTLPHHVILHGYHYYVHRGITPREEIMQCIAALECMILEILSARLDLEQLPATMQASTVQPTQPPAMSEQSRAVDITVLRTLQSQVAPTAALTEIRSIRSGLTQMGISGSSLDKIRRKWRDSQQPAVSEWVDTYLWSSKCLQILIPFNELDGNTIPGYGFCAYLLVYWVYLRDVEQMRPNQIKTRLDLNKAANRKLLCTFLLRAVVLLSEMPRVVPEDPVVLERLRYTANRLQYTASSTIVTAWPVLTT